MNVERAARFIPVAREVAVATFDSTYTFMHVSMIIDGKSIAAVGTNERKTHPMNRMYGYRTESIHSELDAYLHVMYRNTDNMTLINFRFNKSGDLRMAKPCKCCMAWCATAFKEIWYSTDKGMVRLI